MSSYLNFYLVPKKSRKEYNEECQEVSVKLSEGIPLFLMCYSRSTEIYQIYRQVLNPPYIGSKEPQYMELTPEMAQKVANYYKEETEELNRSLDNRYAAVRSSGVLDLTILDSLVQFETEISYRKETERELSFIKNLVDEVLQNDFEKVLINYD